VPERSRVEELIARVRGGDYLGAIADFYHPEASMQENDQPPREGRDVLLEFERKMLERMSVRAHPVETLLVDGDAVVIVWTFDATDGKGTTRRLTELALQHWRGDRIERERFVYDTATAWQVVEP
jgi:ketosteroid isomerase-like protein